jgi:hypothetical protein
MNKSGHPHRRLSRGAFALAGIILAGLPAVAWALPGYAQLINSYCRAQGATRVTYTDNGCTLCHHPGTFVSSPAHRVEPQWSEFELGRSAGGDYSFYCPPSGSAPQLVLEAPSSGSGVDAGPATDSSAHASMYWMSLGYPSGHPATVAAQSESAPPGGAAEAAPRVVAPTPPATKAAATRDALAPLRPEPGLAAGLQSKLATLRADLALTGAQEGAWQELTEAVLAAGPLPKATTTKASSAAELEAQLLEQQRRLAQRTAQLRLVNTALVRLNAQLEERQQRLLAAQLLALIGDSGS